MREGEAEGARRNQKLAKGVLVEWQAQAGQFIGEETSSELEKD
jgi:hypothetical protein